MTNRNSIFVLLMFAFLLSATPASAASLKIHAFTAKPSKIMSGESTLLSWRTQGSTNCQLRDDTKGRGTLLKDAIGSQGSISVSPTKTTTYLLYCSDQREGGSSVRSDSKTIKITVKPESSKVQKKQTESSVSSITQTSVKASSNSFKVSGTAPDSTGVFVALVHADYAGGTDWHSIYEKDAYVAFTGDVVTKVKKGKWQAEFVGVPSGTYKILLYSAGANNPLLASGVLQVAGTDTLKFKAGSNKPLTLGEGQTITDNGVDITLISVFLSDGNSGTPSAMFSVTPRGYTQSTQWGSVGDFIPESGGISDPKVKQGGIRIEIVDISNARNTTTIKIKIEPKG